MTIPMGENPVVTFAPRCPSCGSTDCGIVRSQRTEIEHAGEKCRAQKQWRRCRACGHGFPMIHVKESVRVASRGWSVRP